VLPMVTQLRAVAVQLQAMLLQRNSHTNYNLPDDNLPTTA